MIKKIRKSLTQKIFLLTALILVLACFFTYEIIAYFMPITYSLNITDEVEKNINELMKNLNQTKLEDSGPLFDQFLMDNPVTLLTLYDENQEIVDIPGQIKKEIVVEDSSVSIISTTTSSILGICVENNSPEDENVSAKETDMMQSDDQWNKEDKTVSEGKGTDTTAISYDYIVNTYPEELNMGISNQYNLTFKDSDKQYVLSISSGMQAVNQAQMALRQILPWLVAGILLCSVFCAYFYSRYVTKSVVQISRISKKMSNLEFDWKCDEKRTDEIGILAASLNEMSEKLSAALGDLQAANMILIEDIEREKELEQRRLEFFSAVSHELKTPITIIKGQIEGMIYRVGVYQNRDKYLSRSYEVACTMEGMVQEILMISRLESQGFNLNLSEIDFEDLINTAIHHHEDLFMKKNMVIEKDISAAISVRADRKLMQKVFDNVLGNAAHYSPLDSKVRIVLKTVEGKSIFQVENTGIHVEEESLPRIFEAFYRPEKSRNRNTGGSGLGLYIVKMILDQHQWNYSMENTEDGTCFTIKI